MSSDIIITLNANESIIGYLNEQVMMRQPEYITSWSDYTVDDISHRQVFNCYGGGHGMLNGTVGMTIVEAPLAGIRRVDGLIFNNTDMSDTILYLEISNKDSKVRRRFTGLSIPSRTRIFPLKM